MFNVTEEPKENTKWGLGGNMIDDKLPMMSYLMHEYIPMTKYLTPGIGSRDYPEPNLFDTKEEVIKWVEELKKEFSNITPLRGDKIIRIKSKYANYPMSSAFFGIEFMKKIEVSDIEDNGIKVKCIHPDDSISYYLFKPCAIEDDGWRF